MQIGYITAEPPVKASQQPNTEEYTAIITSLANGGKWEQIPANTLETIAMDKKELKKLLQPLAVAIKGIVKIAILLLLLLTALLVATELLVRLIFLTMPEPFTEIITPVGYYYSLPENGWNDVSVVLFSCSFWVGAVFVISRTIYRVLKKGWQEILKEVQSKPAHKK